MQLQPAARCHGPPSCIWREEGKSILMRRESCSKAMPKSGTCWQGWMDLSKSDRVNKRRSGDKPFSDCEYRYRIYYIYAYPIPPTVIQRINRRQYNRVLELAETRKPAAVVNFMGRTLERSMNLYLAACTHVTAPLRTGEEWVPLQEAVEGVPYS